MKKLLSQIILIALVVLFSLTAYSAKTENQKKQISSNRKSTTSMKSKSVKKDDKVKMKAPVSNIQKDYTQSKQQKKTLSKDKKLYSKIKASFKKTWDLVSRKVFQVFGIADKPKKLKPGFWGMAGNQMNVGRHCLFEIPNSDNPEELLCSDMDPDVRPCTENDIQVCYDMNPFTFCRSSLSSGFYYYSPCSQGGCPTDGSESGYRFAEEWECGSETNNVWAACFESRCFNPYCPSADGSCSSNDIIDAEERPDETDYCIDWHDEQNPNRFGYIVANGIEYFDACSDGATRRIARCSFGECDTPPCAEEVACEGVNSFCTSGVCVSKDEAVELCFDFDPQNAGIHALVAYQMASQVSVNRDHCFQGKYMDAICCGSSIEMPDDATIVGCDGNELAGWLVYDVLADLSLFACPPNNPCDPRIEERWCSDDRTQVVIGHCIPDGICGREYYIDRREDCSPKTHCENGECVDNIEDSVDACIRIDSNGNVQDIDFAMARQEDIEQYLGSIGGGSTWDDEDEIWRNDKCSDDLLAIDEYYCNEGEDVLGTYISRVICPPGYRCEQQDNIAVCEFDQLACNRLDINGGRACDDYYSTMNPDDKIRCAESLGGGTTWDNDNQRYIKDSCRSSRSIKEYYCDPSGRGVYDDRVTCPEGYICETNDAGVAICVVGEPDGEDIWHCERLSNDLNGVYDENNKVGTAGGGLILLEERNNNTREVEFDSCRNRLRLSQKRCSPQNQVMSSTTVEVPGYLCNSSPGWNEGDLLAQINSIPSAWRGLLEGEKPARLEPMPDDVSCQSIDINSSELGGKLVALVDNSDGSVIDSHIDGCDDSGEMVLWFDCRDEFENIDYYNSGESACSAGQHCSRRGWASNDEWNNSSLTSHRYPAHCVDNSCLRLYSDVNGSEPGGGGIGIRVGDARTLNYYDACDGEAVAEQACDGNERSTNIRPCPENFVCYDSDGEDGDASAICVPRYSCSRLSVDINGEVAGGGGIQLTDDDGVSELYDMCLPGSVTGVQEQRCDGFSATVVTRECPNYFTCFDSDGPNRNQPAICARDICERYILNVDGSYIVDNDDRTTDGGFIVDVGATVIHDYCVNDGEAVQIVVCGDDGHLSEDLPAPIDCGVKGKVCVEGKCVDE